MGAATRGPEVPHAHALCPSRLLSVHFALPRILLRIFHCASSLRRSNSSWLWVQTKKEQYGDAVGVTGCEIKQERSIQDTTIKNCQQEKHGQRDCTLKNKYCKQSAREVEWSCESTSPEQCEVSARDRGDRVSVFVEFVSRHKTTISTHTLLHTIAQSCRQISSDNFFNSSSTLCDIS